MVDLVLAMVMALICILLHFEALVLVRRLARSLTSPRLALLATWTGLLCAHVVEIWLYGVVYWGCARLGIGGIEGAATTLDYGYFSAVVYTTLGFGDLVPAPGIQILAASEALVGLCLIAWSATITFNRILPHSEPPPT